MPGFEMSGHTKVAIGPYGDRSDASLGCPMHFSLGQFLVRLLAHPRVTLPQPDNVAK